MPKQVFNVHTHQNELDSKLTVAFQKIADIFRVLQWNISKEHGISPIQAQILIFLKYHKESKRKVNILATKFNLTKPTISDAIKALTGKGLISKQNDKEDGRSYLINLTDSGKDLVRKIENYPASIIKSLNQIDNEDQETVYEAILKLIFNLSKSGLINPPDMCYCCSHFQEGGAGEPHFCNLMKISLTSETLRIDCPEFEEKSAEIF